MIRGVHESTIRREMCLFESEPALREANDALLHFARSHDIVNHWGTGFEASSDLMSLDASKHLYDARVDPKRRVHGVGIYQTVLDQWGIPYDQPLPLLRRQVGAALEGVVRQRVAPIRSLAVDTHGHTYFGSGLARLLGFDLYTRWRDMRGQWLHVPRDWPPERGLEPVLMRISTPSSFNVNSANYYGWPPRSTTATVRPLATPSSIARVRSGGNGGIRYTCATMPRNRHFAEASIEYWSAANPSTNSSVSFTPVPFALIAGADETKVMISGVLTLLTNAVIAYNTWRLHQVLERTREAGRPVPSDKILAHIAPIAFRHINFQGIYRFQLERYLDRLLPSVPQKLAADAK